MDFEDIMETVMVGCVGIAALAFLIMVIVGAVNHPLIFAGVVGALVFIFGLGAFIRYIPWEDVFDEVAIFFRKIKKIKIEWRD